MEKIIREEKLKIPLRLWGTTGALAFFWVLLVVNKVHILIIMAAGFMVAGQVLQLVKRVKTGYRVTLKGLQFYQGDKQLAFVPYSAMRQIVRGSFWKLVKHEAVKNIAKPSYIQAYPKLGGTSELSMLVYEEDGVTKVIQFQPTEALHIFLEGRIKEQSSVASPQWSAVDEKGMR